MKIGQVADAAGVSVDTVRFYERRGVLPAPERLPSGYRTYGSATVERIRLARRFQALGLTLDEVIDALLATDTGGVSRQCSNASTPRWTSCGPLAARCARCSLRASREPVCSRTKPDIGA
jgi:DNA-binding transcriptional MerR regulator